MSDAVVAVGVLINAIINEKKKQQADRKRKYDSLGIYLGNTSDEWERQRTLFGKSHSLLPPISSATVLGPTHLAQA